MEAMVGCDFQHVQMNLWIFVSGESDVADLAGFLRFEHRFVGSALREYAVGIVEPDYLVMLNQVDVIGLQPLQGGFDLLPCEVLSAAVNLRHQKNFLTIAIL